jgi:hypothetical protein
MKLRIGLTHLKYKINSDKLTMFLSSNFNFGVDYA